MKPSTLIHVGRDGEVLMLIFMRMEGFLQVLHLHSNILFNTAEQKPTDNDHKVVMIRIIL